MRRTISSWTPTGNRTPTSSVRTLADAPRANLRVGQADPREHQGSPARDHRRRRSSEARRESGVIDPKDLPIAAAALPSNCLECGRPALGVRLLVRHVELVAALLGD